MEVPVGLVQVVMAAANPARLAQFWSAALEWPIVVAEADQVVVAPPEDDPAQQGQLPMIFVRAPEVKQTSSKCSCWLRIHFTVSSVVCELVT